MLVVIGVCIILKTVEVTGGTASGIVGVLFHDLVGGTGASRHAGYPVHSIILVGGNLTGSVHNLRHLSVFGV